MNLILLQSDFSLFIGRLHPLIVHLPIGFLLLVVIFYFLSFIERFKNLSNTIVYILFTGALSALLSVVVGLLLASKGGYDEQLIGWHKWLAIALVIFSFALWAWFKWGSSHRFLNTGLMLAVLILITVTGHLGGTLTHGERYLFEYAPDFIRTQFLVNNGIEPDKLPQDADSILLYAHLIQPVLDLKCISCHNNNNQSGGLNLTNLDYMLVGGDNGEVLIAGDVLKSELFKRVSMDPNDRKFMPTNGQPLSYTEILLIKEWIAQSLDTTIAISDDKLSDELKSRLAFSYGLDAQKKSFIEKLRLPVIEEEVLNRLNDNGFKVRKLAEDLNLIEVKSKDSISVKMLEELEDVKAHIVWLNLSGSAIKDEHLEIIADYENLVRVELSNNPLAHIESLSNLRHLEVLNLHATQVNDSVVGSLDKMKHLKTVYLWRSLVSEQAVDSLRSLRPDLEVNFGSPLQLKVAEETKEQRAR